MFTKQVASQAPRVDMADKFVITEKASQAKDVRPALGAQFGFILPAEGRLLDLVEPEEAVPAWKRRAILLRREGLYAMRPAAGAGKAAKLKTNREALRDATCVWLATYCEGQLIGQQVLEHYRYRGRVMPVLFTAQDPRAARDPSPLAGGLG
jgi:DNA topoisomerase-3